MLEGVSRSFEARVWSGAAPESDAGFFAFRDWLRQVPVPLDCLTLREGVDGQVFCDGPGFRADINFFTSG